TVVASVHFCSDTDTVSVKMKPKPSRPELGSNSPVCEGYVLKITATDSMPLVNYSWSGPGGFSSPTQDISIADAKPVMSGNYISTVELDGCTVSDTINVLVNPAPPEPKPYSNSPVNRGS